MIASLVTGLLLAPSLTLGVKVDGDGFLRFGDRGRVVYSRSVRLYVSEDGRLMHSGGQILLPSIEVPNDAEKLGADIEGRVSATVHGEKKIIGRIVLAYFEKSQQLIKQGDFWTSHSRPVLRDPGEGYAGVIRVDGGNDPSPSETKPNTNNGTQPVPPSMNESGVISIQIPETSMVSNERFKLGDIATITGNSAEANKLKEIDLGTTPLIGVPVRINRDTLNFKLRSAGFTPSQIDLKMPNTVIVAREGQKVTQAQFLDAAIKAVQQKMGPSANLTGDSTGPDFYAPSGKLELPLESMAVKDGQLHAVIAVVVDGKRLNSRTVKLSGEGLTQGVKAGQIVKVRFITSGYVAEITGRSKQNGLLGQTVEVTVQYDGPGTTTTHAATVIGNGVVEVKL